jgi:cytidylate kinase
VIIAIDGPGGSGKSTVSRRLAERLGWNHLDTGAFYRAATLAALRAGADPEDEQAVMEAVTGHRFDQKDGQMMLDSENVSTAIRSSDVTAAVSAVSSHPELRRLLVREQRKWVKGKGGANTVVEGRDIGTVVFPAAALKVWLEASPAERARRRAAETGSDLEVVEADLARRDRVDSGRAVSPQRPAFDAVHLDTTGLEVDAVVERVLELLPS